MDQPARLSGIVAGIYDTSLDPGSWAAVLGRVRDFVGGSSAGIVAKDTAASRGTLFYDDGAIDPENTRLYFEKYVALDPCTTAHFFSSAEQPVATADIVPADEFLESRFYKEWARPQGFVDYMGAAIERSATTATVFNVIRRQGDGPFDPAARHRMSAVAGHIRRALQIGKALDSKTVEARSLADALDGLGAAVFLAGEDGDLIHANAAGAGVLGEADFLHSVGGKLVARKPEANHHLRAVLAATRHGDRAIGPGGAALSFAGKGGESYLAEVMPLTAGARRRAGRSHGAVAAIFLRKAAFETAPPAETIARRYGLTPGELRVLLAVVDVGGVGEVAETLGIAQTTVKTHLAHLFQKTGVKRQADLVRLVAGFASPLVAL